MARLWRYLFNRSNLFVFFLIILTAANIYLSTNSYNILQTTGESLARIEEVTKDSFNITKIVISNKDGYWLIDNYKGVKVNLGYEILADISFDKFKKNERQDKYFLSKGLRGNANISSIYTIKDCDLNCKYINLISNTKRFASDVFLQSACNNEKWVSGFFAKSINCLDIANLSKGLLIGDVSFSPTAKELFRKTGINHIVAVSGFQVVLISSFLEWLMVRVRVSRRYRFIITASFIIIFLTLVGPQPPILRSVLSIIISFFVFLIGRKVPQNKVLIYSGIILLWLNPFLIFSISFQLSYLATFGLINSFSIPLTAIKNIDSKTERRVENSTMIGEEKLLKWSDSVSGYLIANLSIFLYTMPIIVLLNGYVSIWSIIINMVLIPIIPMISLLNIFALLPLIGSYINIFPLTMESMILQFLNTNFLNSEPLRLSQFSILELIIYYTILLIANVLLKYYFEYERKQLR
jgi:ComEC/Rec2-related protein